jgi:hypothetical protein
MDVKVEVEVAQGIGDFIRDFIRCRGTSDFEIRVLSAV